MHKLRFFRKYQFSEIETQHLLIGTALFTAVVVSIIFIRYISLSSFDLVLTALFVGLLSAPLFFLHEVGHKVSAQHYNLWAEFRLNQFGVILTAFSIISPFKFVAPGAVHIRGHGDLSTIGKVSAYGPATNIVLGGFYLAITGTISLLFGLGTFSTLSVEFQNIFFILLLAFLTATEFSFLLGAFNMLPFGLLDGKKVQMWNTTVFWGLFLVSGLTWLGLLFWSSIFFAQTSESLLLLGLIIIFGIIATFSGYWLLQRLKDPNFDPGKQAYEYSEYETQAYRRNSQYVNQRQVRVIRGTSSSKSKLSGKCAECGEQILLPFHCSTCDQYYCSNHRLSGKHFCYVDNKNDRTGEFN